MGADKSLARPGRKQANASVRMAWISFGALPCRKNNLMTFCVSILLKSRASLTCFRACFLPGRAKDLSAPRYLCTLWSSGVRHWDCSVEKPDDVNLHFLFFENLTFYLCIYITDISIRVGGLGSNPGGDEIFLPSRPALVSTQPPVKWVPNLSRG